MQKHRNRETVGRGSAILAVMSAMAGCGGSGGGSGPASTTHPGGSLTGTTILFQQPQEGGIAGQFFVPLATHTPPQTGMFELILWQPNPDTADGELVPTTWDAGSETGFTPTSPITAQLGFENQAGTSTAQMEGGTVGAYINSANLPASPAGQTMMITPQFLFTLGSEPVPFSSTHSVLTSSMDLQIPSAAGNDTYVVADFLFKDPNGVRVSIGAKLFNNGQTNPVVGTGYDAPSNTYLLNSPLAGVQRFVTQVPGSASTTGTPWLGWQHYEWSVSQAQFVAAINYLIAQFPGEVTTTAPSAYVLAEVHLNAEFHYQPDPAELGWSMTGWMVSVGLSGD
jgi:hypothetical protein